MKAIFTFVFTLVLAFSTYGQRPAQEKVSTVTRGIVLLTTLAPVQKGETRQVARLYRRSNARVSKALSFTTARNRPQYA